VCNKYGHQSKMHQQSHTPKYVSIFQCYCIIVVHTKIHLFEDKTVSPFPRHFPLAATMFVGTHIRGGHKHGCRKCKIARKR
jgi:hypothetical protein